MTGSWRTVFLVGLVAACASVAGFFISFLILQPAPSEQASTTTAEQTEHLALPEGVSVTDLGRDIVERSATETFEEIEARVRSRMAQHVPEPEQSPPAPVSTDVTESLPVEVWDSTEQVAESGPGDGDFAVDSQVAVTDTGDGGEPAVVLPGDSETDVAAIGRPRQKPSTDAVLQQLLEEMEIVTREPDALPVEDAAPEADEASVIAEQSAAEARVAAPDPADATSSQPIANVPESLAETAAEEPIVAAGPGRVPTLPEAPVADAATTPTDAFAIALLAAPRDDAFLLQREKLHSYPAAETALAMVGHPERPQTKGGDAMRARLPSVAGPGQFAQLDRETYRSHAFDGPPDRAFRADPTDAIAASVRWPDAAPTVARAIPENFDGAFTESGAATSVARPADQPPAVLSALPIPPDARQVTVTDLAGPDSPIVQTPAAPRPRETAGRLVDSLPTPPNRAVPAVAALPGAGEGLTAIESPGASNPDDRNPSLVLLTEPVLRVLAVGRAQDHGAVVSAEAYVPAPASPESLSPLTEGLPPPRVREIDGPVVAEAEQPTDDTADRPLEIVAATKSLAPGMASPRPAAESADIELKFENTVDLAEALVLPRTLPEQHAGARAAFEQSLTPKPVAGDMPTARGPDPLTPPIEAFEAPAAIPSSPAVIELAAADLSAPAIVAAPASPETASRRVDGLPPIPNRADGLSETPAPEDKVQMTALASVESTEASVAPQPPRPTPSVVSPDIQTAKLDLLRVPAPSRPGPAVIELAAVDLAAPSEIPAPRSPEGASRRVAALPPVPERTDTADQPPSSDSAAAVENDRPTQAPDPPAAAETQRDIEPPARDAPDAAPDDQIAGVETAPPPAEPLANRIDQVLARLGGDDQTEAPATQPAAPEAAPALNAAAPARSSSATAGPEPEPMDRPASEADLAALRELVDLQRRQINKQQIEMAMRDQRIAALEDQSGTLSSASRRPSEPVATAAAEPAAAAQPAAEPAIPPAPMFIQGGGFRRYAEAKELQRQLMEFGPAEISANLVDGRTTYVVRVGPIYDAAYAENLLSEVADAGLSGLEIVVE